ncbi:hypothetical protein LZ31DRAFT_251089 [Colletotrichum somersetense]|nr:hypothetical protein LZ31DRAFT_251089 [Colletotrichum somersetense]
MDPSIGVRGGSTFFTFCHGGFFLVFFRSCCCCIRRRFRELRGEGGLRESQEISGFGCKKSRGLSQTGEHLPRGIAQLLLGSTTCYVFSEPSNPIVWANQAGDVIPVLFHNIRDAVVRMLMWPPGEKADGQGGGGAVNLPSVEYHSALGAE